MANAIEQVYDKLAEIFGGTNCNQKFIMLSPGTSLNAKTFAYDTSKPKPAIVQEAESKLVDKMFDLAKVTASSNGQRVSSQYLQALSVLVPKFNPLTPILKKSLRDYLNTPMPANTKLNDQDFTGTLQQYYFKLYEGWITVKLDWDRKIVQKKNEFESNPETAKEEYLEWYMQNAEAELAKIDEAMAKVLGVFAPSDMDAILGALSSGPGGEIEEAVNMTKNMRLASTSGGYFYPVDLTPDDWFLDLASDINPTNLLKDPEFISATIAAKRQALQASISQVQMIISQMPSSNTIKISATEFLNAQNDFSEAQNNLINTYTDNTSIAVEIYLKMHPQQSAASVFGENDVKDLNDIVETVSKSKSETTTEKTAHKKDTSGTTFTTEDLKNIVEGQKKLISAQSNLQTTLSKFANSGLNLAINQSSYFGDLPILLTRLQSQLSDIQNLQNDLSISISSNKTKAVPQLSYLWDEKTQIEAKQLLEKCKAGTPPEKNASDAIKALTEITKSKPVFSNLNSVATEAGKLTGAKATPQEVLVALDEIIENLSDSVKLEAADVVNKAHSAAIKGATAESVIDTIKTASKDNPNLKGIVELTSYASSSRTAHHIYEAIEAEIVRCSGQHIATKSETSNRFMELQFSFTSNDMNRDSSTDTSFSQTSWAVDLFFGSASGSRSSSSSVTSQSAFESNSEIKIGLKAAKVDIDRGWFNPGVFKLTSEMNRLSDKLISRGELNDWSKAKSFNEAIMPCFPVSFLITKDVTISFKVSESSLKAVHEVLDSRKAAGGGIFCFNVSSSSASHSDHSSMSTKSTGNVVTITIPSPQILGWFLETIPEDKSSVLKYQPNIYSLNDGNIITANQEDISIINFVKQLALLDNKKVLENN